MIVVLLAFAYLGQKLDAYFQLEKPFLTALCTLVGLSASIYRLIKDLINTPG